MGLQFNFPEQTGPVAINTVGTLTVNDGVVTGFNATSNYLQCDQKIDFTQSDYEIAVRVKPTSFSVTTFLFSQGGLTLALGSGSDAGKVELYISLETSGYAEYKQLYTTTLNNIWSLIFKRTSGTRYEVFVSTDSGERTLIKTLNTSENIRPGDESDILRWGGGNTFSQYLQGSLYLQGTYATVNGQLWAGQYYQTPEPLGVVIDDGTNQTEANYVIVNDKLVWANKKTYAKGPVGYTIIGNPTITDGVVSGFSTSEYLNLTQAFNPSNKSFEVCIGFITGSNIATEQYMFRSAISAPSQAGRFGFLIGIVNNKIVINSSSNSSSWAGQLTGQTTLSKNTSYVLRTIYDGSSLSAKLSTSGGAFATEIPSTSRNPLYNGLTISQLGVYSYNNTYQAPFLGSIDLKSTYIIIDGALFFYGKNYSSSNISFVPSGLTYGNTTTPSVGYVDMETQQFTSAPTGATWGKD